MDAAGPLIVSGYIRDDDDGEEEEAPFLGFGVRFYIVRRTKQRHLSTFFLGLPLPFLCTVSKGFL